MYCTECGAVNDDNSTRCVQCGETLQPAARSVPPMTPGPVTPPVQIPNYLVQAILVTVFCCLPFGIVSIVYAAQVNGYAAAGNIAKATETSNKAKTWSWVAFGSGLAAIVLWLAFGMLSATMQ